MRLGRALSGMACLLPAWCAAGIGPLPNWVKALDKQVVKRIQISGYRRLGFHAHTVSGDREAFNTLNYSGLGSQKFTDIGEIGLTGRKVLGVLNFDARILDSRFTDPQGQKFSIDYEKHGFSASLGDVQGTLLNTNRLASFSKSLRGLVVGYRKGRFATKALHSEAKGSARTISLQGNNSAGPYYLQNSQIVNGSEQVQVDGVPQVLGQDYVINYEVGSLTFVNRVIAPTSVIVATYEALGFNEERGTVSGVGASYDFGRAGRLGLTAAQQLTGGRATASTRLEKFQGYGAPSIPYVLQFEPMPGAPITIRIDGILQVEGRDYTFDPDNSAIFYVNRFVPSTSSVDVVYTPKPRGTVQGDRSNFGLDYQIPLGKHGEAGALNVYQAVGRLTGTATPQSGWARGASLLYRTGIVRLSANLRDIPRNYVGIESRGFNRNERAYDWQVEAKPGPEATYTLSHSNSVVTNRTSLPDGSVAFVNGRSTIVRAMATLKPSEDATWRLTHSRSSTRTAAGETRLDGSDLSTTQTLGRLNARLGLQRQAGSAPSSTASSSARRGLNVLGATLGLAYDAGSRFSIRGDTSLTEIGSNGKRGTGRDYELNARYTASQSFSLGGRYALSDSGALLALGGFQNGFGLGYDGNGFSGGSGSTGVTGATDLRLFQLNADYQPSSRSSLHASFSKVRYTGSVSSNTETTSSGIGASYTIAPGTLVGASIDQSRTTYVSSPLTSSSTSTSFFLDGQPSSLWSYQLGSSVFRAGGNSTYKQNSSYHTASVSYRLGSRQSITWDGSLGRTSGYLPQDTFDTGLTYQYRIWSNLALNASYRHRNVRNVDPSVGSGAYRSGGFDLELAFNFGGR